MNHARAAIAVSAVVLTVLAGLALLVGCEAESARDFYYGDLIISPASTTIAASGSFTLSATGGDGTYSWRLSNSGLGTLMDSGARAVYTGSGTKGTNYVTVTDGGGETETATVIQQ